MSRKYSAGIDFGTKSCRAVVIDLETGEEKSSVEYIYRHGVMTERLTCGTPLGNDYAIQDPADYIEGIREAVKGAVLASGVSADDIIGLGVDFTSSTVLALDEDGMPLCFKEEFASDPHAYAKLWKHHGAAAEAEKVLATAKARNEKFLSLYGGALSPEWMVPKMLETLNMSPKVYENTARFSEGGDFITRYLTGNDKIAVGGCGFKTFWNSVDGYPSDDFFAALDIRMKGTALNKFGKNIVKPCESVGGLNERGSELTGLKIGTPVASFVLDAHAAVPACGISKAGELLLIIGTSTVEVVSCEKCDAVPNICGIVKDGIIPGLYSIEAGQSGTGDLYDWFVSNCVPAEYEKEAEEKNISVHSLLTEKASKLKPGETGLIALDWWNGNRNILQRPDMSGMILGMTLGTKPEDMYRTILEATVFGSRAVYDNMKNNGIRMEKITASGGIPMKNPLLMQIYSDVFNEKIHVCSLKQPGAYGSALYGAVVGGYFETISEAAEKLGGEISRVYEPIKENVEVYEKLYNEYMTLHDYFGRYGNDCMRRLREISAGSAKRS